ncbi:hypothetical protein AcW1_001490 [Taiwanofungus camphoratus]|nr:hypothetical protein AcV7_003661 [Antrodia cinnamomea]KAI0945218.1 hypothetical protein AcW1_001490 [Antrodia cinnamomea]
MSVSRGEHSPCPRLARVSNPPTLSGHDERCESCSSDPTVSWQSHVLIQRMDRAHWSLFPLVDQRLMIDEDWSESSNQAEGGLESGMRELGQDLRLARCAGHCPATFAGRV